MIPTKLMKPASSMQYIDSNVMVNTQDQCSPSNTQSQSLQLAKIIVGFPGIGKSFVSKDTSGAYTWLNIHDEPGYAKGAEGSFFTELLVLAQKPGIILLPAHRMVGNFLISQNLAFTSVFPRRQLKDDYLRRYRERGNSINFVKLVEKRWDSFVDNMWYPHGRCNHVELDEGQFLKDVLLRVLTKADANDQAML
jgi:hypothetical protein